MESPVQDVPLFFLYFQYGHYLYPRLSTGSPGKILSNSGGVVTYTFAGNPDTYRTLLCDAKVLSTRSSQNIETSLDICSRIDNCISVLRVFLCVPDSEYSVNIHYY